MVIPVPVEEEVVVESPTVNPLPLLEIETPSINPDVILATSISADNPVVFDNVKVSPTWKSCPPDVIVPTDAITPSRVDITAAVPLIELEFVDKVKISPITLLFPPLFIDNDVIKLEEDKFDKRSFHEPSIFRWVWFTEPKSNTYSFQSSNSFW